jgi:hypothetical protein
MLEVTPILWYYYHYYYYYYCCCYYYYYFFLFLLVIYKKVKFSLEQAMKAQRRSKGIALFFL